MDIGKSFGYVFEDKKWIEKVLIGGLVSLIPIIGSLLLIGYGVELVRNVRNHEPEPLPEWDDWGQKIIDGLKLFVILFVWALPMVVLYSIAFIPLMLAGNSDSGSSIGGVFATCLSCFLFLYGIVYWLAIPGITIKFAEGGEIGDGFNVGEILDFTKKHLGQIIIVALVSWLVYLLAGLVGSFLCFVGVFFTMFWAALVQYHMIAQIGLEEAPVPAAPSMEPVGPVEPAPELPEPPAPAEPAAPAEPPSPDQE